MSEMELGTASAEERDDGRRIAIFQANWPLQVHTTNVVRELLKAGWAVDVFLCQVSQSWETLDLTKANDRLRVFDCMQLNNSVADAPCVRPSGFLEVTASVHMTIYRMVKAVLQGSTMLFRIYRFFRKYQWMVQEVLDYHLRRNDLNYVVSSHALQRSMHVVARNDYTCLIGVEKAGLSWAGAVADRYAIPFMYFSLELYLSGDYPYKRDRAFGRMLRLEQKYHRRARATIVQDESRAQVLIDNTGAYDTEILTVPVSLCGPPIVLKSQYLRDRLGIPPYMKVILYIGLLRRRRLVTELALTARDLPNGCVLVIHGFVPDDEVGLLDELVALEATGRLIVSTDLVSPDCLCEVVASADVGLVFYPANTLNDRLTGRSSEKAAWFARAGVPIVAFDYPSVLEVLDTYQCGLGVSTIQELPGAIKCILNDYESYQAGAYKAYEEVYEFGLHFGKVVEWLDCLGSAS